MINSSAVNQAKLNVMTPLCILLIGIVWKWKWSLLIAQGECQYRSYYYTEKNNIRCTVLALFHGFRWCHKQNKQAVYTFGICIIHDCVCIVCLCTWWYQNLSVLIVRCIYTYKVPIKFHAKMANRGL